METSAHTTYKVLHKKLSGEVQIRVVTVDSHENN